MESVDDINEVRELIGNNPVKILSKIQNHVALQNLNSIISSSDGIVISRGVLSMNLTASNMVYVQDYIIQKCKLAGKPVFISCQIMNSLINNPIPTHSEMADISLAVHQGVDGLELSGETAQGPFYKEAITTMCQVCLKTERYSNYQKYYNSIERYFIVTLANFKISIVTEK